MLYYFYFQVLPHKLAQILLLGDLPEILKKINLNDYEYNIFNAPEY